MGMNIGGFFKSASDKLKSWDPGYNILHGDEIKAAKKQEEAAKKATAQSISDIEKARASYWGNVDTAKANINDNIIPTLQQYGNDAYMALSGGISGARDDLMQGRSRSLGAIERQGDVARSDLQGGYASGRGALSDAYVQGQGMLGAGYDQARGDLGRVQGLQQYGDQAARGYQAVDPGQSARLGAMLDKPGGLYGGFEQDPGYQFRLQQGEQAINRSAAARGGRLGGDTLKALNDYAQGQASQEYGNFAARQQAQAGLANAADSQSNSMLSDYARRADTASANAMNAQLTLGQMGYGAQNDLAKLSATQGAQQADYAANYGQGMSGLAVSEGRDLGTQATNMGQSLSDVYGKYNTSMANVNMQGGAGMSDLAMNRGNTLAGAYGAINNLTMSGAANDTAMSSALLDAYWRPVDYAGNVERTKANATNNAKAIAASVLGGMFGGPGGAAAGQQAVSGSGLSGSGGGGYSGNFQLQKNTGFGGLNY